MTKATTTPGKFTCVCGPYRGFMGEAECDEGDLFHGQISGITDVATFQGKTPTEVRRAFRNTVDDYITMCEKKGKEPNTPFSGKLNVRFSPELHRKMSQVAVVEGKSLNQLIVDTMAVRVASSVIELTPAKATAKKKKFREAA